MPRLQNISKYWVSWRSGAALIIEGVNHAGALVRALLHAVDTDRFGDARGLQHRRRDVDNMRELAAHAALFLDAVGPMHDRAVARAAPVRSHLLGPLVGCIHRPGPTHREVAVGSFATELIQLGQHEFRRFDGSHAVEVGHLVESALQCTLCRGTIVADNQVDERVVDHRFERIEQPTNMIVGVLQECRVHLHLALQYGLEFGVHVIPGRDLVVTRGEYGIGRNNAQLFLFLESDLALLVPAMGELALVLVDPLLRHVVRRVGSAGREVHEERLVSHERLLLARPGNRLVGQILGQVVTFRRVSWEAQSGSCLHTKPGHTGCSRHR